MIERILQTDADTERLGAELALWARPGMALFLEGDLGSGKSTLARALIRALAGGRQDFDVPSPTFTLVQEYHETRIPVLHADLYRLKSQAEAEELGLREGLETHFVLVEWPELLNGTEWRDVLRLKLSGHGGGRHAVLDATGTWRGALARNDDINGFLAATDWRESRRAFLEGDASFRRYETLTGDGGHAILMDMPARPDGPPVKHGKPYSAIAHLAEGIGAAIAINGELERRGYGAPATHAADIGKGLAIIEDLGRNVFGKMMLAGADMREPMATAVEVLADMAGQTWPASAGLEGGPIHRLFAYDIEAQLIEVELLTDWFWPWLNGATAPDDVKTEFIAAWVSLLPKSQPDRPVWTLRDYHSPNLLWLPERVGLKRVGIIDTQDCLLGHPAYDLASLLQDARVDVAFDFADGLYAHYCGLRHGTAGFNRHEFDSAYALLGAQRATKILGIFARLSLRDGKHGYIRHMPRVSRYLERSLQHGDLAPLKAWFDRHLAQGLRERAP